MAWVGPQPAGSHTALETAPPATVMNLSDVVSSTQRGEGPGKTIYIPPACRLTASSPCLLPLTFICQPHLHHPHPRHLKEWHPVAWLDSPALPGNAGDLPGTPNELMAAASSFGRQRRLAGRCWAAQGSATAALPGASVGWAWAECPMAGQTSVPEQDCPLPSPREAPSTGAINQPR